MTSVFLLFAFALDPRTVKEFEAYIAVADRVMRARPHSTGRLPVKEGGAPLIEEWEGKANTQLTNGLVHDWAGAVVAAGARLEHGLAVLNDTGRFRQYYPEVQDFRVLGRDGAKSQVFLRLVKRKFITVVLDAYYDIEQAPAGPGKHQILSRSAKICEVSDAGTSSERVKPPGEGFGFLWRMNSYWLLEERDGGLYMELRSISLTRDIPAGLAWMIKPMVASLPRETLASTLEGAAKAVVWYSQQLKPGALHGTQESK